jgi:hypothetical protein
MTSFGTNSLQFLDGLMYHIAGTVAQGRYLSARDMNFVIAFVIAAKPQDEIMAALAAQMGAVHLISMKRAHLLSRVEYSLQPDIVEHSYHKLTRTFVMQMDALSRYRNDYEMRQSGQAKVGNKRRAAIPRARGTSPGGVMQRMPMPALDKDRVLGQTPRHPPRAPRRRRYGVDE